MRAKIDKQFLDLAEHLNLDGIGTNDYILKRLRRTKIISVEKEATIEEIFKEKNSEAIIFYRNAGAITSNLLSKITIVPK